MIKKSQNQTGSAHIVIIVILFVAIMGALGWVVWNNYANKQQASSVVRSDNSQVTEDSKENKNNVYKGEGYSFKYSKIGWNLTVTSYEQDTDDVSVSTDDYKAALGMGIDSGAIINIYKYTSGQSSLEQQILDVQNFPGSLDVKRIMINGTAGFSYNSGYEGVRYHTILVVNERLSYDIIYRFKDNGDAAAHMSEYELITSSFKIEKKL